MGLFLAEEFDLLSDFDFPNGINLLLNADTLTLYEYGSQ